jgi:hypothetical protein
MPRQIDPRIELLLSSLDYSFDKSGWQGSTLLGVVRRVDAQTAARRIPGRRTVWEQLLHAAYWKHVVANNLATKQPFARKGSDWPKVPDSPDAARWNADVQLIRDIHARLRDAVANLPPARLDDPKVIRLILGAAAHDAYHTGQINALRKMLGLKAGRG